MMVCCLFALAAAPMISTAQKQGKAGIDSMYNLMRQAQTDTARLIQLYRIGDAYTTINADSSLMIARRGLGKAQMLGWEKGMAAFNISIGNILSDKGAYDSAIYYYKRAYTVNSTIANTKGMYSALINIGTTFQRRGIGLAAINYYLKALPLIKKANDTPRLALVMLNIASTYGNEENFSKSLHYAELGLPVAKATNDPNMEGKAYEVLGNAYILGKDTARARRFIQQALQQYQTAGNKVGIATAYYILGAIDKNLADAIKLGEVSQKIWNDADPDYTIADANRIQLAKNYLKLEKVHKGQPGLLNIAQKYLDDAVASARRSGDVDNLSAAYLQLANLNEQKGSYKIALQLMMQYQQLNDSIHSQSAKNKIAALEANYQFSQKESAYKAEQKLAELRMRQLVSYALLVIILLTAAFLILLTRYHSKQLKLQNRITASELKAVRAQMNPHFIFNVLNSIESYILENDARTASKLVQQFASLTRLVLENSTHSLAVAEREWKALQLYTELEAMRFDYQFSYSFYADPEIDLYSLMLPPMLVQPLIENAIHHGLRNSASEEKVLSVKLENFDDRICFTVEDNGIGIDRIQKTGNANPVKSQSIGLSAIRERIDIINAVNNNDHAAFDIRQKTGAECPGTIAILKLPGIMAQAGQHK